MPPGLSADSDGNEDTTPDPTSAFELRKAVLELILGVLHVQMLLQCWPFHSAHEGLAANLADYIAVLLFGLQS